MQVQWKPNNVKEFLCINLQIMLPKIYTEPCPFNGEFDYTFLADFQAVKS